MEDDGARRNSNGRPPSRSIGKAAKPGLPASTTVRQDMFVCLLNTHAIEYHEDASSGR